MKYRNIVTGVELTVSSRISAPGYVLVDEVKVYEPKSKTEPKTEQPKEEVKEAPKRKRSAKK